MKVAFVASGGGVPGIAWHGGVLDALKTVGFQSMDGVSAGAIAVAIAGQDPPLKIPYLRNLAETIRTKDGHRWKSAKQMAVQLLGGFLGGGGLDTLGDDSALAKRIRDEVSGAAYAVPTFVGFTDIDSGEYFSDYAADPAVWPQLVLASATMGPPLWPPVRVKYAGRERRLVDGGYRNVAPIMDVLARVNAGRQEYPDVILLSSTRPVDPPTVVTAPKNEIRNDSLASLSLLTDTIHLDDIEDTLRINRLIKQVDAINTQIRAKYPAHEDFLLRSADGVPYRYIPIVEMRPEGELAKNSLDDSHQKAIASLGFLAGSAALNEISGG